jgi:hypothetical protein
LIAAAAAVVVVAVVVALSSLGRRDTAADRTKAVGDSFMNAWVDGDTARLAAVLAPDAVFDGWTPETLPALGDWFQALGWNYHNEGCRALAADKVWCAYTVENVLTRAFGEGSVASSFVLTVDGDTVASVADNLNVGPYRDIAIAFGNWVNAQHASDISQMYTIGVGYPRVDPIATGLWKTYSRLFIDSGDAYVARARLICDAAHAKYDELVANAEGTQAKSAAAAQVLSDALAELESLGPPAPVKTSVDVGYSIIGQLVDAYGGSSGAGSVTVTDVLANLPHTEVGLERCAIDPSR